MSRRGVTRRVWGMRSVVLLAIMVVSVAATAAGAWAPTSTSGAPDARVSHTAVWTGSKMIVWGGSAGSGSYLNTGADYDPPTPGTR